MIKSLSAILVLVGLLHSPLAQSAERTVTLNVPGMNCAACPYIVAKALKRVRGVKTVRTSLAKRIARVRYDDEITNISALTKATAAAGYDSSAAK